MTGTQIFFFSYELANITVTIQGFWNIFDWADRYTGHFIFNHKDTRLYKRDSQALGVCSQPGG